MSDRPDITAREGSGARVVVWMLFVLFLVFGGLYVAGYVVAADKVPRSTTVEGVDLSGLTPAAAEQRLRTRLAERASAPMEVSVEDSPHTATPTELGLSVDYAASVRQAGGERSWRPERIWDFFVGGGSYDAVVTVDEQRLATAIERLGADIDHPAEEGRIEFRRGVAIPLLPREGVKISPVGSRTVLTANYLSDSVSQLPMVAVDPYITSADVREAMKSFAEPAMSAPVTLRIGDAKIVVGPKAYSSALLMIPNGGKLVPTVNSSRLVDAVRGAMKGLALRPRSARFAFRDGRPTIIPAKRGVTFDPDEVTAKFVDAVAATRRKGRVIRLAGVVQRPAFSTRDARRLGVTEKVGSSFMQYPIAEQQAIDIARAATLVNGTLVRPGETFSLADTIGQRTAENGFTSQARPRRVAPASTDDGLSEFASTLFLVSWHAGLEDTEHQPPLTWSGFFDPGLEAEHDAELLRPALHQLHQARGADPGRGGARSAVRDTHRHALVDEGLGRDRHLLEATQRGASGDDVRHHALVPPAARPPWLRHRREAGAPPSR